MLPALVRKSSFSKAQGFMKPTGALDSGLRSTPTAAADAAALIGCSSSHVAYVVMADGEVRETVRAMWYDLPQDGL